MAQDIENDDEDVDTEHEKRKRRVRFIIFKSNFNRLLKLHFLNFQLRLCDPVYSVSLKDYCLENLRECERSVGCDQFQQLMNSVDKNIACKLNELLN